MKTVKARDIAHEFRKLNDSLKPGESIQVSKRGKVVGYYQKAGPKPRLQPDFARRLHAASYDEATGEKLIAAALAEA